MVKEVSPYLTNVLQSLIFKYNMQKSIRFGNNPQVFLTSDLKNFIGDEKEKTYGQPIMVHSTESTPYYFSGILVRKTDSEKRQLQAVFHEFRHIWQSEYFCSIYEWWLSPKRQDLYYCYYWEEVCSIERDAQLFGLSLGEETREDLLLKYDLDWLQSHEQELREPIIKRKQQ